MCLAFVFDKASTKLTEPRIRNLISRELKVSKGAVTQHHERGSDYGNKTVLRHLKEGDIVLVNRQVSRT